MLACGPSSDDAVPDQGAAEQSATPTAVAQTVATVPAEESTLSPTPTPSPEPTPTATPTAAPEYSLVTSDPSQPDLIWRFEAPTELWGAAVTEGVVLTAGDNGVVYALDAVSGELLWELEDAGVSAAADGIAYLAVSGSAEDMKYDLTPKNRIHALDASTGELLWSHESFGLVAVTDGIVYAGSWDYDDSEQGILFALTASNGESLWEYEVEAPTMWPVASDGLVYLTTIEGCACSGRSHGQSPLAARRNVWATRGSRWIGLRYRTRIRHHRRLRRLGRKRSVRAFGGHG